MLNVEHNWARKVDMDNPLKLRWRVGRKLGRTVYAMLSETPSEDDLLLGVFDEESVAQHIVDIHNESLEGR